MTTEEQVREAVERCGIEVAERPADLVGLIEARL